MLEGTTPKNLGQWYDAPLHKNLPKLQLSMPPTVKAINASNLASAKGRAANPSEPTNHNGMSNLSYPIITEPDRRQSRVEMIHYPGETPTPRVSRLILSKSRTQ